MPTRFKVFRLPTLPVEALREDRTFVRRSIRLW